MKDDRASRIAGVVLAAGTSSRMGKNKLFLKLAGTSVLRRAVATALEADLDPVLVILGHESDRARAELADLPCTTVLNPAYASGMNTSVSTGIAAVPGHAAGAVLMLADMPLVDTAMLRALVERYRASSASLVVSTYGEVLAPPILYGRALFAELRALDADACGKRVVKQHRHEALELSWPASALTDLDVPGDVERVRAQIEEGRRRLTTDDR
jgi:molybdenum cofactor cytidylyltransferase